MLKYLLILIEKALLYFFKPQIIANQKLENELFDKNVQLLLSEPTIDISELEKKYPANLSSFEGQWQGDESVEVLTSMLNK
jgi:hypothetical protein